MSHDKKQSGFTLIELLLAMSFISMLLLVIALTMIQIASVYNRGIILKDINQVSRDIGDELDLALRASGSFSLEAGAQKYVERPTGGRLCLGQYSYIWNYGKAINQNNAELNRYTNDEVMRLAKVPDSGANYCVLDTSTGNYADVNPVGAVELLDAGDHSLAIHQLIVRTSEAATDASSGQQLYRVTYTIGTNDTDALNDTQTSCKAPNEEGADPDYCAVQQFTLVLRVANGVN